MARPVNFIAELVGTFLFLSVIALSGPVGSLAALPIGSALMALVYMGGHISGAHYNPAVSFGLFLRRKIGATDLVEYWISPCPAFGFPSLGAIPAPPPPLHRPILSAPQPLCLYYAHV